MEPNVERQHQHNNSRQLTSLNVWLEKNLFFKFAAVYLAFVIIKSWGFIPYGRFWAEEGTVFFPGICTAPGFDGIFFLFNNHLELWTNLGVLISSLAPIGNAPAITTTYAIILQSIPLAIIAVKRADLGLSNISVFVVLLAATGMLQAAEVWANTINLHFHFLVVASLILALPCTGKRWVPFSLILLTMCGLSGIPANFLAPLFIVFAILEKSRVRAMQALVITVTAALQIYLLSQSGYQQDRGLIPPLGIILLASLTQSFFSVFWGFQGGNLAADLLRPLLHPTLSFQSVAGSVFFVGACLLIAKIYNLPNSLRHWEPDGRRNIKLISAALLSLVASITLAYGDKVDLISPLGGGRYFYAPNVLFVVVLFSLKAKQHFLRTFAIVSLIVFSLAKLPWAYEGGDWGEAIQLIDKHAKDAKNLELNIWPTGWAMKLPTSCVN
ncbi:MAG: hypothetical protein KUG58_01695 [Marinosulfonomonas sp.]|nr:hypothetical protein [Marinosulfonomonas sp.]